MKKLITLLLVGGCLLSATNLLAQDDENKKRRHRSYTSQDFKIDLGMNNFLMDGEFPDQTGELYTVKPFGSWYVALGQVNNTRIAGPLFLEWGGDVSWYNFKFEDASVIMTRDASQVNFSQNTDADVVPEKSKFVVSYVNASVVPVFRFGNSKKSFRVGAGVYGGYRLGSYTKFTYSRDNQTIKDREKGNYYVDNLRYGLRVRMGFRDVDFFANYDLNEMFVAGRGPALNAISLGISIVDFH